MESVKFGATPSMLGLDLVRVDRAREAQGAPEGAVPAHRSFQSPSGFRVTIAGLVEAPGRLVMTKNRADVEWLIAQGAWMRSLARGLLGDGALAEDVVQEAYAAALARGPDTEGERARPWLAAVVGNLARRMRGREAVRATVEARSARAEAQGSAAELVARMELQRALAEAVLALDEPYRSAVLLRHVEGLGAGEIARRQGCTREAARQRVARGLEALRRALDGRYGERSAWALVLAPLTPGPVLSSAVTLGGVAMGVKGVGLALAGASVLVFAFVFASERGSPALSRAEHAPDPAPEETADAAHVTGGRFTLDALAAGELELFFLTSEDAPAEARAALRTSLELAEGETRTGEFRLERGDAVLRGRVLDAREQPVPGADLRLQLNMYTERLGFGTEERSATTDGDGRFEFRGAFAGHYQLALQSLPQGLCPEPFEDDVELASGETRELELRCAEPIELSGRVALSGLDGAGLDPAGLRVVARAADDGAELAVSVVAADGAFRFPRLYPTEIELRLLRDEIELGRGRAGPHASREIVLVPDP